MLQKCQHGQPEVSISSKQTSMDDRLIIPRICSWIRRENEQREDSFDCWQLPFIFENYQRIEKCGLLLSSTLFNIKNSPMWCSIRKISKNALSSLVLSMVLESAQLGATKPEMINILGVINHITTASTIVSSKLQFQIAFATANIARMVMCLVKRKVMKIEFSKICHLAFLA